MPTEIVPEKAYAVVIAATNRDESFSDVVGEADTYKAALEIMTEKVLRIQREQANACGFHFHQGGAQVSWMQGDWHHAAYIVRRFE